MVNRIALEQRSRRKEDVRSMRQTILFPLVLLAGSLSGAAEDPPAKSPAADGGRIAPGASRVRFSVEIADFCSPAQIATDISRCGQAAISAAGAGANASSGGGVVHFSAALSPYTVHGTLRLDKSFVALAGDGPQASTIRCANGAADCIVVGNPDKPTRDQHIDNLAINGDGKSGGANISLLNTFNVRIERAQVENCIRCFDIGPGDNSVTLRDIVAVPNQAGADYGIYWHAPGDGSARSDVLTLDNVVIEGQWSNATGIMWEGFANTLVASHLRVLHARYGMRIVNPSGSSSYFPSFLNAFDLEMEGFKTRALSIEGGTDFKIVGSDINNLSGGAKQGDADDVAVRIMADAGASYTRAVSISDTRIGGSRSSGVWSDSRDLQLSNVIFYTTSFAGPDAAPVIRLGAATIDVMLSNIQCEEFGGAARASYCLQIDAGARGVLSTNLNARYVRRGAVQDLGGQGVSAVNLIEPDGTITTMKR
jgi:hypothetical protein